MFIKIWEKSRAFAVILGLATLAVSPARAATILIDDFSTDFGYDIEDTRTTVDDTTVTLGTASQLARTRIISMTNPGTGVYGDYTRSGGQNLLLATTAANTEYTIWYQDVVTTSLNSLGPAYLKVTLSSLPTRGPATMEIFAGTKKMSVNLKSLESTDISKGYLSLGNPFLAEIKRAVAADEKVVFRFAGSGSGDIGLQRLEFTDLALPAGTTALTATVEDATPPVYSPRTATVTEAPTIMTSLPGLLIAGLLLHVRRRRLRG